MSKNFKSYLYPMDKTFDTVIGLEIHVQLNTRSKAFSSDKNEFGNAANENINPISIGLPGALPRVNRSQVFSSVKLGVALESDINQNSSFDRKNYFYPDSPKGYQITQNESPILKGGKFTFKTGDNYKTIRIHQVHMEDDAGKSIHDLDDTLTMLDLNRAGTPLLEVVTEPDFSSGQEVSDFLAAFQILLRYIEISDANMEEGSMRCDCNVSVKPTGQTALGTRCEIKNINSKRFARIAINYERDRQISLIESGGIVDQETRLFNANESVTYTMRKKEDALDYRYFSDPDLQPIVLADSLINNIKSSIGLLPWTATKELTNKGVVLAKAEALAVDKNYVIYFLTLNHYLNEPKLVSDFVLNHIAPRWSELVDLDHHAIKDSWVALLQLIKDKKISSSSAYQKLIPEIIQDHSTSVSELAEKHGLLLKAASGNELEELCNSVLVANPDKVTAYQKGKKGLIGFFMGQAMRQGKQFDPEELKKTFEGLLGN